MAKQAVSSALLRWSVVPILTGLFSFLCLIDIGTAWIPFIEPFNFLWIFEGDKHDFMIWFPNWGMPAYYLIASIPYLIAVLAIAICYWILRNAAMIRRAFRKFHSAFTIFSSKSSGEFSQQMKFQASALALDLTVFLSLYFLIKDGGLGDSAQTFQNQLFLARMFVLVLIAQILVSISGQFASFRSLIGNFLFSPSTPHNLAILRVIFFGFMTVVCWFYPLHFSHYFELQAQGLPYMNWYTQVVDLTAGQYNVVCKIGAVVNFFICIGLFTRPFLLVNSVLIFIIIATPNFYGKLSHQHLWIWIPWILTFSKCAEVYSVDSWIRSKRNKEGIVSSSSAYNLPVRLIWLTFGLVYFFPGFQKLWTCGFDWALSDSMLNQVYVEWNQHYGWRSIIPVENYPNFFKAAGMSVILFELSFIFLILHRKTRIIAIISGLLFHVLTGVTIRIWFPPVLIMYMFFINWDLIISKLVKRPLENAQVRVGHLHSKLVLGVGFTLFFFNSICGFMGIYSYPFTSFPGYTNLYADTLDEVYIEVYLSSGRWIDINEVLRDARYRREDNSPFEDGILDESIDMATRNSRIEQYWVLLSHAVIELKTVNGYKVFRRKINLHPNAQPKVLFQELLYHTEHLE